jgi:predicted aspartyl protease
MGAMRIPLRLILILLLLSLPAFAPARAKCEMVKMASLAVLMDGNQILLPATINGQPMQFLLDTGAEQSIMLPSAAKALGLTPIRALRGAIYGVTGGRLPISVANIAEIQLAELVLKDQHILIGGARADFGSPHAVALFGYDFLRRYDIDFDLPHGQVTLYQPIDCADSNLAYWTDAYNVVDLEPNPSQIVVHAKLNNREIIAQLDSGATLSTLRYETAAALGVTPDSPGVTRDGDTSGLSAAPVATWLGRFDSFIMDQETIKPVRLRFHRFPKVSVGWSRIKTSIFRVDMLLGADFLRAHHVLIAHSQNKLYFSYVGGPPFHAMGPRLGIAPPDMSQP